MPVEEVKITPRLVCALIAEQRPDLAHLPVEALANGWDNAMFRLGSHHTVRLPRRAVAVPLIEHEQRWLSRLANELALPLPIPAPLHIGRPNEEYPWSWSICPWLKGTTAEGSSFDATRVATQLGEFLAALHKSAPADAPSNPFRGVPLHERDATLRARISGISMFIDVEPTLVLWDKLCATSPSVGPPVWLHGDLHPANLLVDGGQLSAVIDFGDITSGDRATDLAVAWMLLPPEAQPVFREAAGNVDDDTWTRARGWALALSIAYMAGSADNPMIFAIGKRTWESVMTSAATGR